MYGMYACVIVLTLLIVAASARAGDRYTNYLGGYWVVHPDFAETAKLSEFQFFIGPQIKAQAREGYLMVVAADGSPVANAAVEVKACLRFGSALRASLQCVDECRGSLALDMPDGSGDIPASLDFALSIVGGTLTLYDGENVYACLVKDIAASETALRVYDAAV